MTLPFRTMLLMTLGCLSVTVVVLVLSRSEIRAPASDAPIDGGGFAVIKEIAWSTSNAEIIGVDLNRHEKFAIEKVLQNGFANAARAEVDQYFTLKSDATKKYILRDGITVQPVLNHLNGSIRILDVGSVRLTIGSSSATRSPDPVIVEEVLERVRIVDTSSGLKISNVQQLATHELTPFPADSTEWFNQRWAGLNYYPASASWESFWINYPEEEITRDLDRMAALEANSVRIFLHTSSFQQEPRRTLSIERLERFLDAAHARGLSVVLTCFDMGADYELQRIEKAYAELSAVLEAANRARGVVLVDLKNEADRDDRQFGAARIDAWLTALLSRARHDFPKARFTIGWSDPSQAGRLSKLVDVVSFHDFGDPKNFSERIAQVIRIADGKPVMATEIGHSRAPFGWFGQRQTRKLKRQFAQAGGLDGVLVWTLNDFDSVPINVAGRNPWRRARQSQFGLTAKSSEAFAAFARQFRSPRLGATLNTSNPEAKQEDFPK